MTLQLRERDFGKVGGLEDHIQTLKEMIIYPLLYRELFESHGIEAPRGVLFHGPPGTGKTLVAGAVAAECSKSSHRRVSFYMRKGADCLNKYVGESEKHLQNLFTQAQNTRPSIIFFDEIDGLVPTRSESQEQVHASVVSTLLALMDGLDSKSEVFIIGATNRIDMIDPALRRPGRFDRELYFPLPPLESRLQIFRIHTRRWKHKPDPDLLLKLSSECAGYCGADIQSLCSQAVMESFHRNYPQISDTSKKYQINMRNIRVKEEDFWVAKEKLVPAGQRVFMPPSRPLSPELEPLLQRTLNECLDYIQKSCPFKFMWINNAELFKNKSITCPRVLLTNNEEQGYLSRIAPAILHYFDHLPVTVIDLSEITPCESGSLMHKIKEARASMPGILYLPNICSWWNVIEEATKMVLTSSLEKLDTSNISHLFILATSNVPSHESLPSDLQSIFPEKKTFIVEGPTKDEIHDFFSQIILAKNKEEPKSTLIEDPESEKEEEIPESSKPRRSRRKKGLDVEYLGMTFDSKPKTKTKHRRDAPNSDKNLVAINEVTKPVKRKAEKEETSTSKKLRTESAIETDSGAENFETSCKELKLDLKKLEELVDYAVRVTSRSSGKTVIKLYEELEIISLRYSSKWDRSKLPEELEKEISVFDPS